MMKSLHYLAILLGIVFFGLSDIYASTSIEQENNGLLLQLDSIITNHQTLVKEKEIRINGLRNTLTEARNDADRLALCRQLYDEYLVFDSDSALHYASEARKIVANSIPEDYNTLAYWKLNEAFLLTVQGLYDATISLIRTIDPSKLNTETKAKYFESLSYLYSMRSIYLKANHDMWKDEVKKANEYRDSIRALDLQQSSNLQWIPIATALDEGRDDIATMDVTDLKKIVDNSKGATRQNAINAYWLSRYYEAIGDEASMVKYKTKSAINDALIVNREIAAIHELAYYLYEHGDLNRAYNYLIYTDAQVNLYHNRYRIVNLSDLLPKVRDAYREELEKRDKRLSIYIIILAVLSLVLIGSIIFIILEYNKLKKMKNLLKETNNELTVSIKERDEAIEGMEKVNKELKEANTQKLGLIAYAFKLTTQYINALEDYRKKLLKKYKVKRIDDLGVLINDPELIKEQYQGFYEGFDKTVLSIFPDFIKEYNQTVGEDNRFSSETIAKTKTLNTKLRIYALKRLGISKSAEIAEMLNVSIRTVYNNRSGSASEETDTRKPKDD